MYDRLYIHIPFCRRKCPYCAFDSQEASSHDLNDYAGLLLHEMELAAQHSPPQRALDSVYIGGGTPSLLDPLQVGRLIERAGQLFGMSGQAEVTLEANPGTVDLRSLTGFRRAGVTRLSLGVQSFDDGLLARLGRIHTARQAREAFDAARRGGFDNIGIDLIHALPGQDMEMWQSDLRQALELGPQHLSVYGLAIEEGTPFAARYAADSPLLPDEDLAVGMFEAADDILTAQGYEHYEIANYALPGCRSRHNSGYWKRDGYLGLGAGAHSFLQDSAFGTRFNNTADLGAYATALQQGTLPRTDMLSLSREDAMAEFLFLGLRMSDGVSFSSFADQFGTGFHDVYGDVDAALQAEGLLEEVSGSIRLTRRGMLLSNHVFRQFLP